MGEGVVLTAESGGETTDYLYGLERVAALNGKNKTEYAYDGRGSVAAELRYTDTWYTLGGVLSKAEVTSRSYTPFGEQIGEAFSGFGYNGEYYNANTGMLYLRARFYEPEMNRFSQKDILRGDISVPNSLNRYAYVRNDPVNFIDPSGMSLKSLVQKELSKVTNAVKSFVKDPIGITKKAVNTVVNKISNALQPTSAKNTMSSAAARLTGNKTGTSSNFNTLVQNTQASRAASLAAEKAASTANNAAFPSPQPGPPPELPSTPQYWSKNSTSQNSTASPTVQLPNSIARIRRQFACEAGTNNRDAALEYARIWVGNTNTAITGNSAVNSILDYVINAPNRNTDFYNYKTNCANFVSQCLLAGGIEMTEDWHTNPTAMSWTIKNILTGNRFSFEDTGGAWAQADGQYSYFNDLYGYIEIENQQSHNDNMIKIGDVVSEGIIQPGDLLYFVKLEDGAERVDHATIITSVTGQEILYAGNTVSRYDMELSEALDNSDYVRVYIVHING